MTWLAARDPGFHAVRHLLNRNGWRVANVKGCWRLYEGRRTIAAALTTSGLVLRIRALEAELERVASCNEVANANDNQQPETTPGDDVYTLRTGT